MAFLLLLIYFWQTKSLDPILVFECGAGINFHTFINILLKTLHFEEILTRKWGSNIFIPQSKLLIIPMFANLITNKK